MKQRILVVDDERQIRSAIREALEREGYAVDTAERGEAALACLEQSPADLVLLDIGLPGMSGIDVCRAIRTRSSVPIVILSVRYQERDKVAALDLGADDYLTKPFGMEELLARVRAHLRRWRDDPERQRELRAGDLFLDLETHLVNVRGQEVRLTPIEYQILHFLMLNAGRVVTRDRLQRQVWGCVYESDVHALHTHITNLRRKIELNPLRPRYILTEPSVGYRFIAPP